MNKNPVKSWDFDIEGGESRVQRLEEILVAVCCVLNIKNYKLGLSGGGIKDEKF
jgi:hypothetical protein